MILHPRPGNPPIRPCGDRMEPFYEVAPDGKSITFAPCMVTSYHPKDVEHRYCAFCGRFFQPAPSNAPVVLSIDEAPAAAPRPRPVSARAILFAILAICVLAAAAIVSGPPSCIDLKGPENCPAAPAARGP